MFCKNLLFVQLPSHWLHASKSTLFNGLPRPTRLTMSMQGSNSYTINTYNTLCIIADTNLVCEDACKHFDKGAPFGLLGHQSQLRRRVWILATNSIRIIQDLVELTSANENQNSALDGECNGSTSCILHAQPIFSFVGFHPPHPALSLSCLVDFLRLWIPLWRLHLSLAWISERPP